MPGVISGNMLDMFPITSRMAYQRSDLPASVICTTPSKAGTLASTAG